MKKILLFSDYKGIYEITYKIIEEDYKLEWRTYDLVEGNQHFVPDAVIMHLDSKMLEGKKKVWKYDPDSGFN